MHLKQALNVIHLFGKVSGLKLNVIKSEILQISKQSLSNRKPFNLSWQKEGVYALGSRFNKDVQSGIKDTYRDKADMITNIFKSWSHRNLPWLGKITIVKSIALAK